MGLSPDALKEYALIIYAKFPQKKTRRSELMNARNISNTLFPIISN